MLITQFYFQATFTNSNNAFGTQEWSDLARDISRLRLILPLAFWLVGWFFGSMHTVP
jgi:hypothetical protein